MADGEGTGEGTGQGTGAGTGQQAPSWTAQLPSDLKGNEVFTKYSTIGDLGKSHIEVLGKIKELDGMTTKVGELEGQLKNSIPRLPENPTPEQIEAYHTALGRPGKPEEYEFPSGEIDHDENMVKWARNLFYEAGLTKTQATKITQSWDGFIKGMVEAEAEFDKKAEEEANKNFRGLFKSEEEYTANLELSKRFWKKVTNTDLNTFVTETGLYMHPTFLKFIIDVAKKTGEDITPPGSKGKGGTGEPGPVYDKTTFPKQQKYL